MTQGDDRILEFLHQKSIGASANVIAYNIDYTRNYVSRRCGILVEKGLLEKADTSIYEITELGEQYLAGDLDADDLETGCD